MVVTAPKIQEEVHQCRWLDCTTIFENAETLYEHITTVHIGRKSAGTLSLECKWAGCSSKASKRDHLTSHARVHINLKPHTCSICTKAFKRPQDLKKHEKIHTEEHHTQHKHSKAVTVNVPTMGIAAPNGLFDEKQQQAAMQMGFPGAFLPANFGFGYPMFQGHPGQPGLDLAQVIAQQQQLNAQVQAGYPISALQMQGMPGMPGFPMSYPGGANFPGGPQAQAQAQAAQAHAMQVFAAQSGMFPYGATNPYAYHPSQQPIQMPQQPQQPQHQQQQQALRPPTSAPAHTPTPISSAAPATASIYPNVSNMYGLYSPPTTSTITTSPATAAVKVEDLPSPAASAHSHTSARSAAHSHHSSSVSPRVPALSPPSLSSPENTYSPPSEHETEAFRRSFSGNAVAGKKRAFEETAGQFLGDMKNKRFQEEDAVAQLDAMSNFLFSPELTAPPLTPARSQDDSSGSSIASDYSNADVNTINDLLLSLGQTIEGSTPNVDFHPLDINSCQPQQQFNHPALPAYSGSMYPTLPTMDRITTPSFAAPRAPQTHSIYPGNDFGAMASVRLSKPVAAPSIANDHKLPTYTTVGRLNRAAPMSDYRTEIRGTTMEVDDEEENDSRYTSSLRSTSLDVKSAQESSATKLAPILAASRVGVEKPRLPSIAAITAPSAPSSSGSGITLPSIRDMLERHPDSASPGPISSPMSDSSSTTSSSSARTIYPSFPTSSSRSTNTPEPVRPQSSGGTVERLTHRVHKLDMRHHEAGDSAPSSVIADDLSESDEDENDDHPSNSKKSRVESPEPMSVEEPQQRQRSEQEAAALKAHEELKQRRLFVLKSLIVLVNANYRAKLAAEAASRQPQPQAEAEVKVEEAQPQAIAA